ncbi:MAG: TetR/AcrR family transcriptional regulator [Chloroflexota bacterium]|jgi:TetR/AcrR family transcriptional regulator, transcriptional repressor for nem operon
MARTKAFDEAGALSQAMELFWRCGYEATSVRDLTGRLGISSSSLYTTFGDKREVFLSSLSRYRQIELEQVRELLESPLPVLSVLAHMFAQLIDQLLADEDRRGSFTLNAAVELGGRDAEVAAQLREHYEDIAELLTRRLAGGQQMNEITTRHPADELARFILNSMYSLGGVAKMIPDRNNMESIANLTLSVLESGEIALSG